MKTIRKVLAGATALALAASASAQMSNSSMSAGQMSNGATMSDSTSSGKGMPMTSADMKKWDKCQAMANDMMMKDKKCMSLKMKHDNMSK